MNEPQCIFCRIVAGDEPASFVFRDDVCDAFMDNMPINPGHLLIVPKAHGSYLADIAGDMAAHLMAVAHRMAAAVRTSGVSCDGVNIFLADGEVAGQEVFHVHLHVIPRFSGDGFRPPVPAGVRHDAATRVARRDGGEDRRHPSMTGHKASACRSSRS